MSQRACNRASGLSPLCAVLLALSALSGAASAEESPSPGREAFVDNKCNMCHSVAAQDIERTSKSDKMKAEDLSAVGDERDAGWIVEFIKKETDLDGEEHQRTFKGSDEELAAIADWLSGLKSEGAEP